VLASNANFARVQQIMKEATARIKINKLLGAAGSCLEDKSGDCLRFLPARRAGGRSGRLPFGIKRIVALCPRHHANRINPCSVVFSGPECNERLGKTGTAGNKNPGIVTGMGPGENLSGGPVDKDSC